MKLIHPFSQPKDEHVHIKEMSGHFLIGEQGQWYDLSAGTGCNIFGFTQPDIQAKIAETKFKFPNDDWTTKSSVWFELENILQQVLPKDYTGFVPALTGSDSVDNALKVTWRYWTKKQKPKHTILVRKGSFHSGSITGWQMTDDQEWIKDWPSINFVDFFDEDFDTVYQRHKNDLAGIIIDTVNWYQGISVISDNILEKIQTARKDTNCLLIVDEILTGMWRFGHFSDSIHRNINPDIICFGKAITGGFDSFAITILSNDVHDVISKYDTSMWDNFPLAIGNTRSQNNAGATATTETIKKCLELNVGETVLNEVSPFVEKIANILKQVSKFEVTYHKSILYCNFRKYKNEECKIFSTFLNSHKLWNSEHTRIWFLSFYDLNKVETQYIEQVFQKFVTLVNNGKIWDQSNWKNN